MALHNINLLQNPIDINLSDDKNNSDTFTLGDKYLIQSLANLGQRNGIKGDSIIYNTFNFYDVFENYNFLDSNNYIGKIIIEDVDETNKKNKKCVFSIVDKKNLKNIIYTDISINNITDIKNDIYSNIIINNIDLYSKKSTLTFLDDKFINISFGKIAGTKEDDKNNQEIIYNIFDSNTNELDYAIRAYYLYNDNISNYYLMFIIKRDDNKTSEIGTTCYTLNAYKFNSDLINNKELKHNFENAFTFSENETNYYIQNLINNFTDINKLFEYSNIEDLSLFGMFMHYSLNNELNNINETVNLIYNSNNNEYLYIDPNQENITITKETFVLGNNISLEHRINFINNDIIYLYPKLLEYYSNIKFKNNKQSIYKSILYNIYEYLDSFKLSDFTYFPLYIPLNYNFIYTCNSNDLLNIYNSKDIFITLSENINNIFNQKKSLIYNYDGIDKIKNISFNINYNNKYTDYISNIKILDIYTLPYVSDSFTWNINDIDTKISVLGKDAGNPNIIMIYNYKQNNKIKHKILSGANLEKVNNANFITRKFTVNPESNIIDNTNKFTTIECECEIPEITEKNKNLFNYSLLIVLSDISCTNIFDPQVKYINNIFTSLWTVTINANNTSSEFNYITENELTENGNKNNYALDISYLLNVKNILLSYINNILTDVNSLKFDNIFINAKNKQLNQSSNILSSYCAIIDNLSPNDYKNDLMNIFNDDIKSNFESKFDFYNQYNLNIKYANISDNIEYNAETFNQSNKFINSIKLSNVTNSLYPIYKKEELLHYESAKAFKNHINTQNAAYNINYKYSIKNSDYEINKYSLKSNEQLLMRSSYNLGFGKIDAEYNKIYPQHLIYTYTFGKKDKYNKISYFYNEYLPNDNIPFLDNKEILLANNNALNRVNILSIDKSGYIYNSYIGSQFDIDTNKENFTIGTSSLNINLGSSTLVNHDIIESLKPQKTIDINFNDINLNGNVDIKNNLKLNTIPLINTNINNTNIYTLDLSLIGKLGNNIENIADNIKAEKNKISFSITKGDNYNIVVNTETGLPKDEYTCSLKLYENNKIQLNDDELFYKAKIYNDNNNNIPCLIYINLNKLLDNYIKKLFNVELNDNIIFEYNINNNQYIESETINKHSKILKTKNNKYLLELSCNNYGTLSKYILNDENYNSIHLILDNIKFIIYKQANNDIHIKYISFCKPFINKYE